MIVVKGGVKQRTLLYRKRIERRDTGGESGSYIRGKTEKIEVCATSPRKDTAGQIMDELKVVRYNIRRFVCSYSTVP